MLQLPRLFQVDLPAPSLHCPPAPSLHCPPAAEAVPLHHLTGKEEGLLFLQVDPHLVGLLFLQVDPHLVGLLSQEGLQIYFHLQCRKVLSLSLSQVQLQIVWPFPDILLVLFQWCHELRYVTG